MSLLILTHSACLAHDPSPGHPESPARLEAIQGIITNQFNHLECLAAPQVSREQLARVHAAAHIDKILSHAESGHAQLDPDTALAAGSVAAALHAAGAGIAAVDAVLKGEAKHVFCAVRPPGHHAEPDRAMGFCIFNNISIAAAHALANGIHRVAIVDFDVHHGNGTQAWAETEPRALFCSSHQYPLYPGTGAAHETGKHGNILNVPLPCGSGGGEFRAAYEKHIFPRLEAFAPEILFISAGFDAHRADPLGGLSLAEEDFAWVTRKLAGIAGRSGAGRLISFLEGGYNIDALAASVAAHLHALDFSGEFTQDKPVTA